MGTICPYRDIWVSIVNSEKPVSVWVVDTIYHFVFQHLTFTREFDSDSLRHYSWAADTLDNVNLVSSPVHSG